MLHCRMLFIAIIVSLLGSVAVAQRTSDIYGLVSKKYIHGLPYVQARSLGSGAVPDLLSMLQNPEMQSYWSNIVVTLGYIADPSATRPLIDFLTQRRGEVSYDEFKALIRVPLALGHIAYNNSPEAISLIKKGTSIEYWNSVPLQWSFGRYKGSVLGEVLARISIRGLGMSGNAEAMNVLSSMRSDPTLRKDWDDNVDEAMDLNKRISQFGPDIVFGQEN